jgi:hypothetical protein
MTPLHSALAELPRRRFLRWRTTAMIVGCSLVSMTIAVVVMGWQVSRLTNECNRTRAATIVWPSRSDLRHDLETQCALLDDMRRNASGLFAEDSSAVPDRTSIDAALAHMMNDCAAVADMRRTHTGFYAP